METSVSFHKFCERVRCRILKSKYYDVLSRPMSFQWPDLILVSTLLELVDVNNEEDNAFVFLIPLISLKIFCLDKRVSNKRFIFNISVMFMIYMEAYSSQAGKASDSSVKTDNFFIHDYFQRKQVKFKHMQMPYHTFL